jgi:hypothetical protein
MAYNNDNKEKSQSLGALWIKNKGGKDFYSGKLTIPKDQLEEMLDNLSDNGMGVEVGSVNIVVFNNNFKKSANQPDYNIFKSITSSEYKKETIKNETDFSKIKTNGNKSKKKVVEELPEDDDYDESNPPF